MYKFVKSVSTFSFISVGTLVAKDTVTGLPPTNTDIIPLINKLIPLTILSYFLNTSQTKNLTKYYFLKEFILYKDISNTAKVIDFEMLEVGQRITYNGDC